jgi:hypothetical protein
MGSNQNVGINISGAGLSSIRNPYQESRHGRPSNMGDKSDITEKADVDQIFDDVDDGVKSARVSIAGGEDEGDEN